MESTFENRANYDFHKNDSEISDDNIDMDDYQDLAYNQTHDNKFYRGPQNQAQNFNNQYIQNKNFGNNFNKKDSENYSDFDYEDDDDINFQSESQQDDFESIDLNVNKFKKQINVQNTDQSNLQNKNKKQTKKQIENQDDISQTQQTSNHNQNSFRISNNSQYQSNNITETQKSQEYQQDSRPDDFLEAEEFKDDLSEEVNQFYESQKLSKFQQSNKDTFKSDFEDVEFSETKKSPKNIQNTNSKNPKLISAFSFQKQDNFQSQNIVQQKQTVNDEYIKNFENQIDQQIQIKLNTIQKEKEMLFNENQMLKNQKNELQDQIKKMNQNVDMAFNQLSKNDVKKEEYLMQMQRLNEELKEKNLLLQQREDIIQKYQKDKICPQDIMENKNQEIQILNEQIKYLKDENKILQEQLSKQNNVKFGELNQKIQDLENQLLEKENLIYQQKLQYKIDNINDQNLQELMTQEQIINGYIKENKRLIEENRFYRQNYYKEKIRREQKFLNPQDPDAITKEYELKIENLNQTIKELENDMKKKDQNMAQLNGELQKLNEKQIIKEEKSKSEKKKAVKPKNSMEQRQLLNQQKKDNEEIKKLIEQVQTQIKKKSVQSQKNYLAKGSLEDLKNLIVQLNHENKVVKLELENIKKLNETNHQFVKTEFNNYLKQKSINDQEQESKKIEIQQNHDQQDQKIKQIEEENQFLQAKTNKLSQQLLKLREENEKLLEIIKKMPKQARNIDFAILEQKVINMEKEYKLKKLQYDNAIKIHTTLSDNRDQEKIIQEHQQQQNVIQKLKEVIKNKDIKLLKFKQSFDELLTEFRKLQTNKHNQFKIIKVINQEQT